VRDLFLRIFTFIFLGVSAYVLFIQFLANHPSSFDGHPPWSGCIWNMIGSYWIIKCEVDRTRITRIRCSGWRCFGDLGRRYFL
jgi:hypothetical protein